MTILPTRYCKFLVTINIPTDGLSTLSAILALFATTNSSYSFLKAAHQIRFSTHLWLQAPWMPSCKVNKLLPKPTEKKSQAHCGIQAGHNNKHHYSEQLIFFQALSQGCGIQGLTSTFSSL